MEWLSNIDVRKLSPGFCGSRGNAAASGPRNLPSTRAGGQDDVSLNKLPQTIVTQYYYCLREFVLNSRHPDPRRVWKVGSGARLATALCRDPGDPGDPRDPRENSETSIFDNPSVENGQQCRKTAPGAAGAPDRPQAPTGRPPGVPGRPPAAPGRPRSSLRAAPGRSRAFPAAPLGAAGRPRTPPAAPRAPPSANIYRQTPDPPHSGRYVKYTVATPWEIKK